LRQGMESQTVTLSIEAPGVEGLVLTAVAGVAEGAGGPRALVGLPRPRPRGAGGAAGLPGRGPPRGGAPPGGPPGPGPARPRPRRARGRAPAGGAGGAELVSAERARPQGGTARGGVPIDLEALPLYLREISAGTLLTAEEEVALARALRSGDPAAAEAARRRLI